MYCDFYHLTERPFNVTPDPKFLYLNARYREAIASLNYGITQRKGFITLIGEAGTGKTTLLKRLLEDLDAKTKSVFIFNTNVTFEEILEYIFAEFDLPLHNGKKLYMLQRLNTFLLEELRGGGNVALLIDEAQDLEFSVLEDLRLLSNLETAKEKILQIVLSGQPELGQKLSNPVLRQLRQRIGINCRLLPLSRDEITEYVRFRLQAAGCPDLNLFSREAEDQIHHFSHGIPRLVNVVCDNALVIGYALGKKRIGAELIAEAAADLLSVEPPEEPLAERPVPVSAPSPPSGAARRWRGRLGMVALLVVVTVIGVLSVGRTMRHRGDREPVTVAPPRLEVIRPGSQPNGIGVEPPLTARSGAAAMAAPGDDLSSARESGTVREVGDTPPVARPVDEALGGADTVTAAAPVAPPPQAAQPFPKAGEEDFARAAARLPSAEGETAALLDEELDSVQRPEEPGAVPEPAPRVAARLTSPGHGWPSARTTNAVSAGAEVVKPRQLASREQFEQTPERGERSQEKAPPSEVSGPRLDGVHFSRRVVRAGDSLASIALQKYGQATYTILDLVRLANPEIRDIDHVSVGQTIRLPELTEGFPILNEGSGRYGLLVFSTPQASSAAALQKALRDHNFDARISSGSGGTRKPVFRVLVSGFGDRSTVATVGAQLQQLFRQDAKIAQMGE
jgi:type II secretory pathway predicted ATPase ExeA